MNQANNEWTPAQVQARQTAADGSSKPGLSSVEHAKREMQRIKDAETEAQRKAE